MESTLHRQLKELYSGDPDSREVSLDGYRIDVVAPDGRLIEIQSAPLSAIKEKTAALLQSHEVLVVKPLAARKYLIRRKTKRGKIVSARYSPVRATVLDVFDELVHFVDVFPHERLTLEVLLVEIEEQRIARRPSGRWKRDYRSTDRKLREVQQQFTLQTTDDLWGLLPDELPDRFTTADLALAADVPRWFAQKIAYCLRKTGAAKTAGKCGNAWRYEHPRMRPAA